MAELTRTMEETSLRYTKDKQGLRQRVERLQAQMDKTEDQINENNSPLQALLYGGSKAGNGEEAKDEEEVALEEEGSRGIRGRKWGSGMRIISTVDQGRENG